MNIEVKIDVIVKKYRSGECVSKVHPKAIIIGTIVLVAVALVTYVLPIIGLILCLFATIPGIIMWHKSIATFGIGALLTVVITTLLGIPLY